MLWSGRKKNVYSVFRKGLFWWSENNTLSNEKITQRNFKIGGSNFKIRGRFVKGPFYCGFQGGGQFSGRKISFGRIIAPYGKMNILSFFGNNLHVNSSVSSCCPCRLPAERKRGYSIAKLCRCLLHALDDTYAERAAFFAEATLDAFPCMMIQQSVVFANGLRHVGLSER